MRDQSESAEVVSRLGAVALEFCSVVESAPRLERTRLLTEVYRLLPKLLNEATKLPCIRTKDEDDASHKDEDSSPHRNARMTYEQWEQIYSLLKEKLGDWDPYWQVFDPTTDKEAVCGTVGDDIADIYRDLEEGLVLSQMQGVRPEDVIWEWRLGYYSHWGHHAINALLTIHFRLQGVLE